MESMGSGSSISSESGYGPGSGSESRVLMTKNWKKDSLKFFLSIGRPTYKRSLQPIFALQDLDPDPGTPLNPDPDTDLDP